MTALARWCFHRRGVVVLAWLAVLIALGAATGAVGSKYNDNFQLPGTESAKALKLLGSVFPQRAGDSDQIVLHTTGGAKINDPAVQERVSAMLTKVAGIGQVASVTSPYSPAAAAQVSKDGTIAFATVNFTALPQSIKLANINDVIDTAKAAAGNGLKVELGGQAIKTATQQPPGASELIGLAAAAVVLFVAFGSLLAMALPLITAIAALGTGILGLGLLSNLFSIGTIAPTLAALIGLGVGIDYALFIVTRYRRGLQAGLDSETAAITALNTSGRAVLFAGSTVVVALLGLLVLGVSFLSGMGTGAAFVVLWTMVSALTLTPALLGFMGDKVLSKRERRRLADQGPLPMGDTSGFWARWAHFCERHKGVLSAAALLVILALALPTLQLRLGISDAGNDGRGTTTRKAYDLLAQGFGPGYNGPLQLVAETPTAADRTAFGALVKTVAGTDGVASAVALPLPAEAGVSVASVIPTTAPQAKATSQLIKTLRNDVVPPAEAGTSMRVYVGGATAIFDDFADVLTGKLPLFIGVIVGLGFLLLLVAFRSLLVPAVAAAMNLLAAAASFGMVTAVFQLGFGINLLGVGGAGPVEAFLPVIMLAILFGLSMDYQVFLVSRMHEEWVHTRDNERAVTIGQAETGRVITAAATIMIAVFAAFLLQGERTIAEFGIGLASAVAIDAFIVRTVLVPSLMHLLGRSNWYLPAWLDRVLPHLSVEGSEDAAEPEPQRKSVTVD